MARTTAQIDASAERIFAVLSDPEAYADWVVGSDSIRDADPAWPAVGTRFHHRVGMWPITINDHTEVIAAEPPRCLELRARARPLGTARVKLLLEERGSGTHVTMIETAGDLLSRLAINPLSDPLVHMRNVKSLKRLKRIVETGVVKT